LAISKRAKEIHDAAVVIDGHNDLPWRLRTRFGSSFEKFDLAERHSDGHTDIPRLREGGVGAQFFAAYVPSDYVAGGARIALEQIDLIKRMIATYDDFEPAYTAADIRRAVEKGKIAALIGVEGGQAIENSLAVLRMLYELGARYLTLTHISSIDWADAATDEARNGGLTDFGEDVVREMNRLGMLVDISHVSADTMADVMRVSGAPVIASHSGAQAVNEHSRNVPDDILRLMPGNGGVVMVNFYSGFVVPEAAEVVRDMFGVMQELKARHGHDDEALEIAWREYWAERPFPRGGVGHLVDHIDHIARVAGVDHVGLGSDYDGVSVVPEGLDDVSGYPAITEELVRRGYGEEEISKILGGNLLRALGLAEDFSRSGGN
jgi:membrane dipeptidase